MELWQLGVTDIAAHVRKRDLSAVEVIAALLRRIDALDGDIQAFVTVDRDGALRAAADMDAHIERGERVGPLAGVPVGLKDIFYTKGLRTTASSKALADFVPTYDATSVARLREAGAIILGKLHTAEFAASDPPPTHNPWNLEYTPGGSSSGSGAAVAAGMLPAATGSQTGGSTLRPAAYNGIVGLKPSYGLISCHGVIPLSWSFDTIGILTRSVKDAACLLEAMAGYDPKDPVSVRRRRVDYMTEVEASVQAPRIGLLREFFLERCEPEIRRVTEDAANKLVKAGALVEEVRLPEVFARFQENRAKLSGVETAAYHEAMFKEKGHLYGPRIAESVKKGLSLPAVPYARALRERPSLLAEFDRWAVRMDAFLTPATPTPPLRGLASTGDSLFQVPWSYSGLPTIAIPVGKCKAGLPLDVQLIAARWHEAHLLRVARWCETVIGFNEHPACWSETVDGKGAGGA